MPPTRWMIPLSVGIAALAYLAGFAAMASFILFTANASWPRGIDQGPAGEALPAVLINMVLVGLFAVQHSVMARRTFKADWTQDVPPHLERSVYVLATAVVLGTLVYVWQPLPALVWRFEDPALRLAAWALHLLGWGIVFVSTFLISHTELFGLAQVRNALFGKLPSQRGFHTPFLYRFVRHPMMSGFLLALWAGPEASQGRVLLAGLLTVYIIIGIALEDADLQAEFGEPYRRYARRVPALIPGMGLLWTRMRCRALTRIPFLHKS